MSLKGFQSAKGAFSTLFSTLLSNIQYYATMSLLGQDKAALDTAPRHLYQFASGTLANPQNTGGVNLKRVLKITTHGRSKGDVIRFTSGDNIYVEVQVDRSLDANNLLLAGELPNDAVAGDTFDVLRYITPSVDESGSSIIIQGTYTVVDRLDVGILDLATPATIPKSSSNPLAVVASLASRCKIIRSQDTIGQFIGIWSMSGILADTLLCQLGPGGSMKEIDIAAGTKIGIRNLVDTDITGTGGAAVGAEALIMEFIG